MDKVLKGHERINELVVKYHEVKESIVEAIAEVKGLEIVRTKRIDLKPMDSEEAVLQMNMFGHNFFIYQDAETNETNIVYRRKDGKYGLIETN